MIIHRLPLYGFAACCEEWLCLSAGRFLSSGLRPLLRRQYLRLKLASDLVGIIPRYFENKGAAQAKGQLNGKAQPFLTTGGEAEVNNKLILGGSATLPNLRMEFFS